MMYICRFFNGFGEKMGEATTQTPKALGLKTQPESWVTWLTFKIKWCLVIVFSLLIIFRPNPHLYATMILKEKFTIISNIVSVIKSELKF